MATIATHSRTGSLSEAQLQHQPRKLLAHARGRPSLSNPISWLGRTSIISVASSHRGQPPSPLNISEPIMVPDRDSPGTPTIRLGALGEGAVLVGTPQDGDFRVTGSQSVLLEEEDEGEHIHPEIQSPTSPMLFGNDASEVEVTADSFHAEQRSTVSRRSKSSASTSSRSARNAPPSKAASTPSHSRPHTPPPPLPLQMPTEVYSVPVVPSFKPILLHDLPEIVDDLSQTIVSIETSTMTHRTTLATLVSRPSQLSRYLEGMISDGKSHSPPQEDQPAVVSAVAPHQIAHIFLDRPSSPYPHILEYLRSPSNSASLLPRGASLLPYTAERLQTLLELRDEAKFLDLNDLYIMCSDELVRKSPSSYQPCSRATSLPIIDVLRESTNRRSGASSASTAVESPRVIPRALADQYIPPAAALKSRSRSDSRSEHPPKPQGGWI